jgi:hypothetical protein
MASLPLSGQRAKTTNNQQANNSSTEKGVRMWRVRAGSEGCSRDAVDRTKPNTKQRFRAFVRLVPAWSIVGAQTKEG